MADKRFSLTFDASMDISQILASVKKVQNSFDGLKINAAGQKSFNKVFLELENAIKDFESKSGKEINNLGDMRAIEKSFGKVLTAYGRLKTEIKNIDQLSDSEILKMFPDTLDKSFDQAIKSLEDYEKKVEEAEKKIKKKREQREEQEQKRDKAKQKDPTKGKKVISPSEMKDLTVQRKEVQKARVETAKEIQKMEQEIQKRIDEGSMRIKKDGTVDKRYGNVEDNQKLLDDLAEAKKKGDELANTFDNLEQSIKGSITKTDYEENLKKISQEAKTAEKEITRLEQEIADIESDPNLAADFENLRKEVEKITGLDLSDIPQTADGLKRIKDTLDDFKASKIKEVKDATDGVKTEADQAGHSFGIMKDKMEEVVDEAKGLDAAAQDIKRLVSNITEFFSINNAIQIFRNAVKDAFETVKELDAAMTETAVVTDYDVGDMWSQLPQYTKVANDLGTTTLGAYETMTLFYQQGLNTNEAFAIGTETMKMARIANMDYADATDKMTAALRGFNMELTQVSAQRINDVYSELAAITAADTNEIATAMTKTASIADSANMEFETTAAFLSQIIETTRESAETAGTAMKTVIARFQELKKDPSEIGEIDGEIVDANKIETALRTVGVALRDAEGQFRDLDDVFLELSSKWSGLDTNTQRYIATIAAGSRQQSRFIAMMSNYSRTMELVSAANNSAGASQKQFEKTMESMESKLNKLKNAWDQFTMGIANSSLIKAGVDALTWLLNTINSLTDVGSEGLGGIVTSILRLGTVLLGLKAGSSVFNIFTKQLEKLSKDGGIDIFGALFGTGKEISGNIGSFVKEIGIALGTVKKFFIDSSFRGDIFSDLLDTLKNEVIPSVLNFVKAWGGYIAIAAVVIAATVAIAKGFKKAKLSSQISDLEEKIATLGEGADEAKQELNDINEARTGLKSLEDQLNNLTKGTDEWKAALVRVNQEVLGLLEKYPELEVITGSDGQLTITDNSWDAVIEKQQQTVVNYSNAIKGTQAQISQLKKEASLDSFVVDTGFSVQRNYEDFQKWPESAPTYEDFYENVKQSADKEQSERSDFQKKTDAFVMNWSRFLDSEAFFGQTWGDVFSSVVDGMTTGTVGSGGLMPSTSQRDFNDEIEANGGYVEQRYKELTGLSSDQFMELAADFTKAGITFADGIEEAEYNLAETIFKNAGIQDETGEVFYNLMRAGQNLGKEMDSLGSTMVTHDLELAQQSRDFVRNAISNTDTINKDYSDALTNVLSGGQFKDLSIAIEEAKGKITETGDKLKERYATEFGYYFNGTDIYKDAQFTQKMEIDEDSIKQAIATAEVTTNVKVETQKLEELLNSFAPEVRTLFSQVFSTSGQGITTETLKQFDGVTSLDQIANLFNFENAGLMAKAFNMEIGELAELLSDNFTAAIDRIQKSRQSATSKLAKVARNSKKAEQTEKEFLTEQANRLKTFEEQFGENFRFSLENIYNKISLIGEEAADTALQSFIAIAETDRDSEGNKISIASRDTKLKDIETFVNNVDWSSPIQAAHQLRMEIEHGTGASKEYAAELLKIGNSALGTRAQLLYLINSADFSEMSKNFDEIIDKNGEIGAGDILDLADNYSDLDKMMDNTGASAAGLARMFTLLRSEELQVHQLTDAVIASLAGFDSVEGVVRSALKGIEEFDPGIDENAFADFVSQAYDAVNENLKKGAVGNSQNRNYLDFLFGKDWDKDDSGQALVGDALVERMQYLTKFMGKNTENMKESWVRFSEGLAQGKDLYGREIEYSSEETAALGEDLGVSQVGNEIVLTGYEGKTSAEIVSWIQDAYNVSQQYAEMMLGDLKNNSADLEAELANTDYASGIKKAYESLKEVQVGNPETQTVETKKIIDQSEIDAIAAIYDRDPGEVAQQFAEEYGAIITNLYDEQGQLKTGQALLDELDKVAQSSGAEGANWIDQFMDGAEGALDLEGLQEGLSNIGIPDEALDGITQDIIDAQLAANNGEPIEVKVELSDGSKTTVEVTPEISLEEATAKAERDLQNSTLAEAIAEAFGKVEINITNLSELGETITKTIKGGEEGKGYEIEVTATPESLAALTEAINTSVDNADPTIEPIPDLEKVKEAIKNLNGTKITIIGNIITPGYAEGIKNSPYGHPALVSEEGPELIQTEDGAYLTGLNGPELAYINKGDTVYTAEETKRILHGKVHDSIPRFEVGVPGIHGYGYTGSSGGSSNDNNEETWENSFDKLFNILKSIEEAGRERERIERRYEALLASIDVSANGILKLSKQELENLETQRQRQEQLIGGRQGQIQKYQEENPGYNKYAQFEENEFGEQVLRIDWEVINAITDPEEGKKIEEYVGQLEDWAEDIYDAKKELDNINQAVQDIKKRGQQEYTNLESQIKDALVDSYQKEIDELSNINESINDTNAALIDAIEKSIDKIRQERENQRTEEDLAEKQRRLIYLQQDTSGANQNEILALEKEIREGTEDYTDKLIDQKISQLQEQNDKAAQQREQQITIAQAQLEHYIASGEIWKEVYSLMDEGLDKDKGLLRGSKLAELLQDAANFSGLSAIGQQTWWTDFNNMVAQGLTYLELGRQLEDIGINSGVIEFYDKDGNLVKGTVDKNGSVTTKDDKVYKNVYQGYDGKFYTSENPESKEKPEEVPKKESSILQPEQSQKVELTTEIKKGVSAAIWNGGYGWGQGSDREKRLKEVFGENDIQKNYVSKYVMSGYPGKLSEYSYENMKKKFTQYKTGGIADFTGPAWLDGTKTKPELILNAKDTQNFIQLKNVLASFMANAGQTKSKSANAENSGEITYDIDINVESIGSDYDVEQLASKIKSMINSDARYRNNNAISLTR